jgi:nucleotide-binding universal stress UspA family protein
MQGASGPAEMLSFLKETTMTPIRTILHPTDFSDTSMAAFHLACSLARDHGARLVVLHVVVPQITTFVDGVMVPEPEVDRNALWRQLENLQEQAPDVAMELRLLGGAADIEILDAAKETKSEMIVIGTHGRTGLGRLLMGSVAEQIVRKASCPVLTVKTPLPAYNAAPKEIPIARESRKPPIDLLGPKESLRNQHECNVEAKVRQLGPGFRDCRLGNDVQIRLGRRLREFWLMI